FEFKNYFIAVFRDGKSDLQYSSNLPKPLYGANVSYRWLNVGFSLALPKLSVANTNFEESKGFSLSISPILRKFYFRNFYEEYRGYRLLNPEATTTQTSEAEFPELKTQTFHLTAYHGFNHQRFSYRNLIFQNEQQKKSAGSILAGISGGFKWINSSADKPFVPDSVGRTNPRSITGLEYFNIGINLGYAYTFVVHENFNASGMLVPGLQYLDGIYKFHDGSHQKIDTKLGLNAEFRIQLGYNSKKFFGGISFSSYLLSNWIKETAPVGSFHNYIRFNVGYHFHIKPIKFLKPVGLSN
ncbi:MAG: DUF4421 domain-containing protein, partial [Schleiferiaceae bacterium]|nr:DUF4421 domain-containing protein [Schleiferiaceae bacterium]